MHKHCTVSDLESFKSSPIWLAITEELQSWLEDIHIQLEDNTTGATGCSEGLSDKELHRLGGNAQAVRRCQDILYFIIMQLKDEKELEVEENE